jgi:hypothetical protein
MPESEEDFEPTPPPRKNDVLFGAAEKFPMANACLNYAISDYGYREGYRRAGKLLAEYVCNECKHQDLLVYPIVHNYRHHLELMLKHLIGVGSYLSSRAITPEVKRLILRSHNLDQLWRALKPVLSAAAQAVGWNPDPDDIEGVESYVQQVHAVDKGSFAFRYATDTEGSPSLPGLTHLNIYQFAELMERLAKYLDTIAFGFSMEEDLKSEYETYLWSLQDEYYE